uniref:EpsG family protein n=1 Tax=Shewanella marina TaxID=487319 RepID=UPI00046FE241
FMYKGICYFTKRRSFAILLFYLYLSLLMFSEQLRQAISFVIVLYSVKYILVGSRLKFLSLIGMASLFHVSAVFGIIIMFYNHIRITIKHLILYLIAAISFNLLLPIIYGLIISALSPESTVSIKLNTYSDLANASPGVGFFVVFDIFWIYMLYLINAKNIFDTKVDFLIKISIVSCFFHIIFYSFPPLQRLFSYLFFAQILLTVNIVKGRVELEKVGLCKLRNDICCLYILFMHVWCFF